MALWLFLSLLVLQNPISRVETGTVTGIVRLPDGKPAAGVRVAAMVPPEPGFNLGNASELAAIGKTDVAGRYRLEDVPVGRYYIVAGRVDAPTYYPGVPNMTGATALSVTAGSLAELDFVISTESARAPDLTNPLQRYLSSVFPLSGPPVLAAGRIVIDAGSSGAKLPASITLNTRNETNPKIATRMAIITSGSYAKKSSVGADGTFGVSLEQGESTISVQGLPEGYSVKSMTSGSTDLLKHPLNVQSGMPEIVIVLTADLRPRFRVEGRVVSRDPNRRLMGEQIELHNESGSIVRLILDAQGRFSFLKLLPGDYRLRLASAQNAPEQRITVADRDVTGIEVTALE